MVPNASYFRAPRYPDEGSRVEAEDDAGVAAVRMRFV